MSRLAPGLITLDKGLDLNTAKIAAPEGTLLDSLNYEQVDFMGQKRIDGYVRYDGSLGSYQDTLYRLSVDGSFSLNEVVFNGSDIVGVVVGQDGGNQPFVAIINDNLIPAVGDLLSIGTVSEVEEFKELYDTDGTDGPELQYAAILASNQSLRERTTDLPGPVAGLHWFNDRLYAVASVAKIEATTHVYPNETLDGRPVLKVADGYIYLGGLGIGDVGSDMASLFQSRTEQQALDELSDASLYGWDFVHQGWVVPFEHGVSLFGSLSALNRNRQGVGVQGPTSITGNNGKPLFITQKVEITNMPVQVNGWKSSNSRTTYNLDVHALDEVDNWSIYADSFFSWDGDTGQITTDGINSGSLIEYSPTATVEIEL